MAFLELDGLGKRFGTHVAVDLVKEGLEAIDVRMQERAGVPGGGAAAGACARRVPPCRPAATSAAATNAPADT